MSGSNSQNFLKAASNLIKGDLSRLDSELKERREERGGVLYGILCNLICHAQINVFDSGYTKKAAAQFKADVVVEVGISEKQAGKYTESISAGLGVRGVRKGMRPIDGLPAAAMDGLKAVAEFLKERDVETFNAFTKAVRIEETPAHKVAKQMHKLTDTQRAKVQEIVAKLDKAQETDETEE